MERNIEQVNGWYNQAIEMNEKLYAVLNEVFRGNELVTYGIEINRWDTFISLKVFAMIAVGGASEELRELAGTFLVDVSFNEYTQQETIDGFVEKVVYNIKPFVRRAKIVEDLVHKNKEDNN